MLEATSSSSASRLAAARTALPPPCRAQRLDSLRQLPSCRTTAPQLVGTQELATWRQHVAAEALQYRPLQENMSLLAMNGFQHRRGEADERHRRCPH